MTKAAIVLALHVLGVPIKVLRQSVRPVLVALMLSVVSTLILMTIAVVRTAYYSIRHARVGF
jgi:hypothetical protein